MEGQIDLGSRGPSFAALVRGGGMVLAVGGLLFVVATVLHPSQETPVTILETEVRLVSSHAVYIVSYALVLLGLPALYSAESHPPIPIPMRDRIFEPFQTGGSQPTQPDSIGLGLSISRQLARAMGGDLTYRYTEGQSIFKMTLPLASRLAPVESPPRTPATSIS